MIIEYLQAALEEDDPELFVKAVGNVVRAMGMTMGAKETQLGRSSLYKAPSGERDPRIGTVMTVLGALGVRLSVAPRVAQGHNDGRGSPSATMVPSSIKKPAPPLR